MRPRKQTFQEFIFKKHVLSICQKYRSGFGDTVVNKEMKTPALLELKFYWRVHGRQGFPDVSVVKESTQNGRGAEDTGLIPCLDQEDPLEEDIATQSSILT